MRRSLLVVSSVVAAISGEALAARCKTAGACLRLGTAAAGKRQPVTAHELFVSSCWLGSGEGCYQAGLDLELGRRQDGLEIAVDLPGAITHFRKACDAGVVYACRKMKSYLPSPAASPSPPPPPSLSPSPSASPAANPPPSPAATSSGEEFARRLCTGVYQIIAARPSRFAGLKTQLPEAERCEVVPGYRWKYTCTYSSVADTTDAGLVKAMAQQLKLAQALKSCLGLYVAVKSPAGYRFKGADIVLGSEPDRIWVSLEIPALRN